MPGPDSPSAQEQQNAVVVLAVDTSPVSSAKQALFKVWLQGLREYCNLLDSEIGRLISDLISGAKTMKEKHQPRIAEMQRLYGEMSAILNSHAGKSVQDISSLILEAHELFTITLVTEGIVKESSKFKKNLVAKYKQIQALTGAAKQELLAVLRKQLKEAGSDDEPESPTQYFQTILARELSKDDEAAGPSLFPIFLKYLGIHARTWKPSNDQESYAEFLAAEQAVYFGSVEKFGAAFKYLTQCFNKRFTREHLDFLIAAIHYKRLETPELRKRAFLYIQSEFTGKGSKQQVNLNAAQFDSLAEVAANIETEVPGQNVFDAAFKNIQDLCDRDFTRGLDVTLREQMEKLLDDFTTMHHRGFSVIDMSVVRPAGPG